MVEKGRCVNVSHFCSDKKQLNYVRVRIKRSTFYFCTLFQHFNSAGCLCLTEYCIHRVNLAKCVKREYGCNSRALYIYREMTTLIK